ncbi:hypothetical protein CDLVIII_2104 [Clostridium sp. DL-VIII]|uniref:hypothetical protein n=1 Tax=Clostridium sp. DL-VIII TaxID=641107 RepID=UPI00023AFA59|nr:hypothetical protein [Clostridium sp. DL-VIII]EHI98773.1 hypothetical protein CDLVIII_2104 [Clostridium sp. DL-VIII]
MENIKRIKKLKSPTKQLHVECEIKLYEDFEAYCHRNGKDVSKAIRGYMKLCIGE